MSNRRIPQRRWKKTLDVVATGLEEIAAYFDMEGFSPNENDMRDRAPEEIVQEDEKVEEEDGDEYDFFSEREAFPREDIELAIDAFLSHLIQEHLLPKSKAKAPSFSAVFAKLFGDDHEITKKADDFEEHIKGYFGFVDYPAMITAYSELQNIQGMIKEATREAADAQNE